MNIAVITGASSGMGREFVYAIDKDVELDELWVIARREDRLLELQEADKASASGGQDQAEAQRHEPQKTPPQGDSSKDKSRSSGGLKPERRDRSIREAVSEVKSDGQA